jgi:glutathione S-transferase
MKLYYSPGACSLSPHIILRETNTPFVLVKVDMKTKKTEDGQDLTAITPAGYVPALELDDGTVLTEGPVIVQYVADKAGATLLAPSAGTLERYKLQSWLNFISTELHKGFSPFFNPRISDDAKAVMLERLMLRIGVLDKLLAKTPYIMGKDFSVADAYAFTVLSWAKPVKIDLSSFANIGAYLDRVAERPAVVAARKAEGLIK